jgi:hypothetical protein
MCFHASAVAENPEFAGAQDQGSSSEGSSVRREWLLLHDLIVIRRSCFCVHTRKRNDRTELRCVCAEPHGRRCADPPRPCAYLVSRESPKVSSHWIGPSTRGHSCRVSPRRLPRALDPGQHTRLVRARPHLASGTVSLHQKAHIHARIRTTISISLTGLLSQLACMDSTHR